MPHSQRFHAADISPPAGFIAGRFDARAADWASPVL